MERQPDIHEVFWSNVEWHAQNKNIPMSLVCHSRTALAKAHKANITLKRIAEIAALLEIEDYAILFEDPAAYEKAPTGSSSRCF